MSNTEKEVLKQDTPVQDEMLDKIQDSADQEEVQVDQSNESLDQAIEEAELTQIGRASCRERV